MGLIDRRIDWGHVHTESNVSRSPSGSELKRDWTLLPHDALALVVNEMQIGQPKYGDSWKNDPLEDHLKHLIEHAIAAYNCQYDWKLEHLAHAVCRALFAIHLIMRIERDDEHDANVPPSSTVWNHRYWEHNKRGGLSTHDKEPLVLPGEYKGKVSDPTGCVMFGGQWYEE